MRLALARLSCMLALACMLLLVLLRVCFGVANVLLCQLLHVMVCARAPAGAVCKGTWANGLPACTAEHITASEAAQSQLTCSKRHNLARCLGLTAQ